MDLAAAIHYTWWVSFLQISLKILQGVITLSINHSRLFRALTHVALSSGLNTANILDQFSLDQFGYFFHLKVNKLEEDGRAKKSSASFQDVGQAGGSCLACSLQGHVVLGTKHPGQWSKVKISKQAIYFFLSNRARIWAFFGESAHEAARSPKPRSLGLPPTATALGGPGGIQARTGWAGCAHFGSGPGVVIFEEIKM